MDFTVSAAPGDPSGGGDMQDLLIESRDSVGGRGGSPEAGTAMWEPLQSQGDAAVFPLF